MTGISRPARTVERLDAPTIDVERQEAEIIQRVLEFWRDHPVDFVLQVLGGTPDPWQCDVMDAVVEEDNVAIRACHGVGKTALLAWLIIWFTVTRRFARVPVTAPTFNRQVKDVLWAEIQFWWDIAKKTSPWLTNEFELLTTRMQHRDHPKTWFALGVASSTPFNTEGFHSPHLLAIIDEAKAVRKPYWDSASGMRTTQEAKLVVASTPGGPIGEFFKVFTSYRETWRSLFVIHPIQLRAKLRRREAPPHSKSGTYYSTRVRDQFIDQIRLEQGEQSPAYIARVIGDFPTTADDVLIPYHWIAEAIDREDVGEGLTVVACDVSRYGRDRTVVLGGKGGTLLRGDTLARTPEETTAIEAQALGVGDDPKRPRYKSTVVTAEACRRMRVEMNADVIVIDDTGVGGGVTDLLKAWGERVIPIDFGSAPTDRPRTAEEAKTRQRRHRLDSHYVNIKAQMGFALRGVFELGGVALANLRCSNCASATSSDGRPITCEHLLGPLTKQLIAEKYEMDIKGRYRLIDPDDQDEVSLIIGSEEGRRSPDHLHALLLYWWVASGQERGVVPRAGAVQVPAGIARIGERERGAGHGAGQATRAAVGIVAGQAAHVRRWYR